MTVTPTTFIAIVLAVWASFHLAHSFLSNNSYLGEKVSSLLLKYNITISFFNIRWFTVRWNRFFIRVGRMWHSKLRLWFNAGVLLGIIAMLSGTVLLCHTLYMTVNQIFFKPTQPVSEKTQVLSVIVPGVNLPIQDIWYLMSAVFMSGVLHEFGHAIAATSEGIQINGFGMFIFLIYPGAFVDLKSEDMSRKDPLCRLRVYCAGVWHNFIVCLVACGLILTLPWLLFPFYSTHGRGVIVTHQTPNSPLDGNMGLRAGDHVIKVDGCRVSNTTDWFYCINKTRKSAQWGSCVSLTRINSLSSHSAFTSEAQITHNKHIWMDCCDSNAPQTHLCYQYVPLQTRMMMFSCVPGRVMISAKQDCLSNEDCSQSGLKETDIVCARAHTEPGVKFIRLVASRERTENNVLFVGDPADILRSVTVSDMFPRFSFLPLRLPSILQRFLQYVFSMSGALAVLNIVPCYALDGQWAFKEILNYCNKEKYLTEQRKEMLLKAVLIVGTSLLAANILFGFIHLFAS